MTPGAPDHPDLRFGLRTAVVDEGDEPEAGPVEGLDRLEAVRLRRGRRPPLVAPRDRARLLKLRPSLPRARAGVMPPTGSPEILELPVDQELFGRHLAEGEVVLHALDAMTRV